MARLKFPQTPADAKSRIATGGVLWVALLLWAVATPGSAAERSVHYAGGLLTVKARGEPLAAVLQEVQQRTGVAIKGVGGLTASLARDVVGMPLLPALRALLEGNNFLLLEGARAGDTRLIIVAAAAGPSTAMPAQATGSSGAELEAALRDEDAAVRIDAVERLGERGDERSLALVAQLLSDPVDAVRAAAQQVVSSRRMGKAPARRVS